MKRTISILLVLVMCLSIFPVNAFAWSSKSHANSANIMLLELQRSAKENGGRAGVTIYDTFDGSSNFYYIPEEYQEAIFSYPDAFRAGSLGPDFYPDLIAGQMIIHPYDKNMSSGDWISVLCDSVNILPKDSEERKEALSFTLGYMFHYCGDLFGHDFINTFSGGPYPDVMKVLDDILDGNKTSANLNNVLSHMSTESYMDSQMNWDFYKENDYLDVGSPTRFVTDTLIGNGSLFAGHTYLYDEYGELPPHFEWLIDWRTELYKEANEWRDNPDPTLSAAASAYLDAWIADQDKAIYALTDTFDTIAARLVSEKDPSLVDVVTEELKAWGYEYGIYIIGIPDVMIDVPMEVSEFLDMIDEAMDFIDFDFLPDIGDLIEDLIEEAILAYLGIPHIDEILAEYGERIENPAVQLDHPLNPYMKSENNFEEFKQYMDKYAEEQELLSATTVSEIINGKDGGVLDRVIDSEFEAFYNTLVMFKLILMGPVNFNSFVYKLSHKRPTVYKSQTEAYVSATGIELEITTADLVDAGTDDDIYAVVYKVEDSGKKTQVMKKLLDISYYNDFEAGNTDKYFVELPEPVKVDRIEVSIEQEGNITAAGFWKCEDITITPLHAGVVLTDSVSVGGNNHMDSGRNWHLNYQNALNARNHTNSKTQLVTSLQVQIRTGKAGDTPGTNSDVYLEVYNGDTDEVWESVLLDKPVKDDFESGNNDTYIVPIAKYNHSSAETEPVALDKLIFRIRNSGSDEWLVSDMWITPYNGKLQLTDTIYIPDDVYLENSYLEIVPKSHLEDANYKKYSELESFEYETNLSDGLIKYVKSIDGSAQWADYRNTLWRDFDVRGKVFFRIFKGFGPEMEYSGTEVVDQWKPFDMTVSFDGMWNGVRRERREEVAGLNDMAPVEGKAMITFVDQFGNEIAHTREVPIVNGKISFEDYICRALTPDCYDIKVTYIANEEEPMYSDAVQVFPKALIVEEAELGIADVKTVEVFDIDLPIEGENPDYQATLGNPDIYQFAEYGYDDAGFWWYDSEGVNLFDDDEFVAGETYTLEIKLSQKKDGNHALSTFTTPVSAYVNGEYISDDDVVANSTTVYIYAEYVCMPANKVVDIVEILDIEPPYSGEEPDYTASLNHPEQYEFANYGPDKAGFFWYDSEGGAMLPGDEFVAGETYTLEVKVSQKKSNGVGLTTFASPLTVYLNGEYVPSENVTVTETTVYVYNDYVCKPRNNIVNMVEVLDINKPVAGKNPDYIATLGAPDLYDFARYGENDSGFFWYDSEGGAMLPDDEFVAGETYTLEIKLSQKWVNGHIMTTFGTPLTAVVNGETVPAEDVYVTPTTAYVYVNYVCEGSPVHTISGNVKAFGDTSKNVTVALVSDGTVIDTATVTGNTGTYTFENVEAGDYVLRVYKTKHATREYAITVADEDVIQDVAIWLYGDVTCDGVVNAGDTLQINRKVANLSSVFNLAEDTDYRFKVANVTNFVMGDVILNAADTLQINRKTANMSSVFDAIA